MNRSLVVVICFQLLFKIHPLQLTCLYVAIVFTAVVIAFTAAFLYMERNYIQVGAKLVLSISIVLVV